MQHCSSLQELHFCGPNPEVKSVNFSHLPPTLEVLVVDQQIAFNDDVLKTISCNFSKLRSLSCGACYEVSDQGLQLLSLCQHLKELNISYCHLVGDAGVAAVAEVGVLHKLIARACPNLTDKGVVQISHHCTSLLELDISGCWKVTTKSLYALQENLLHMRENRLKFILTIGGTDVDGESATKFAIVTGSAVCLHNLSVASLQADYHPLVESDSLLYEDEEDISSCSYQMERAHDWLQAEDPAMFSDEFSDPEDVMFLS